ncbi:MAG: hypothetical protein HY721_12840, partial [Planctomycetes bacterium]|nr:hypothetical protein [Planctomycetota bacterium]
MSLAELKERVAKLTPRERLLLSSFLAELEEADEHGFRSKADERMKAMDAGRKVD